MAFSCLISRFSTIAVRGHAFINLKNDLLKGSSGVSMIHQSYHLQSPISGKEIKNCDIFEKYKKHQSATSISFSTTTSRLSGHKDHDHSKIWTFERLLSFSLLPLVPASVMAPNQALDTALALIIVMHTHFGLEAIVVDYVRPILFGNLAPKIGLALLYIFSIATLAGLLNLIYNDIGLANTVISILKK